MELSRCDGGEKWGISGKNFTGYPQAADKISQRSVEAGRGEWGGRGSVEKIFSEHRVVDVGLRGIQESICCAMGKYPTLSIGFCPDDFGFFCICPGWGAVVDFGQKWRKMGDLEGCRFLSILAYRVTARFAQAVEVA